MNTADANPPIRLLMRCQQVLNSPQPDWMVQAPQRDMWVAAIHTDAGEYELYCDDYEGSTKFNHRSAKSKQTVLKRPLPGWARYPAGVLALLGDDGLDVPGFSAVLLGDEPPGPRYEFGSGLVMAALCYKLCDQPYAPDDLLQIVERVRREYMP